MAGHYLKSQWHYQIGISGNYQDLLLSAGISISKIRLQPAIQLAYRPKQLGISIHTALDIPIKDTKGSFTLGFGLPTKWYDIEFEPMFGWCWHDDTSSAKIGVRLSF